MKLRYKLLIASIISIVALLLCFFIVLKSKTKDVSSKAPYKTLLHKKLTTIRPVTLAKNLEEFSHEEINIITEDSLLFEGVEKLSNIPAGSIVEFDKAIHYTAGISGFTHNYLIGHMQLPGSTETIRFEYSWGDFNSFCLEKPCNYWTYPLGFWQNVLDNEKYFIK